MTDHTFASATELAAAIRAKSVTSESLLAHYLDRVDRYNPALNAIIVDIREQALADARAADAAVAAGTELGPLHGVPMTVKESYGVAGTAATWGNPAWADNVVDRDCVPVQKLKDAGAVVFGKTNVPLALADFQSYNDVYGTTNNPYDHTRGPGGSSGGSAAALAAGLTGFEIGSDIGGSIRNPAHYCGVFGHKPTWNLLWMYGHSGPGDIRGMPDLSVIGPLARSAGDLDVATRIMAGPDDIAARGYRLELPEPRPVDGMRVAVWHDEAACPVSAEVADRVERVAETLASLGATIDASARPAFSAEDSHQTYQTLLQAEMAARTPEDLYDGWLARVAELDPSDDSPNARTLRNQTARYRDWKAANERRAHLRWAWHEFFQDVDLVLMPVMSTPAFPHDHSDFNEREITVDNQTIPYFSQVFWAGLVTVAYMPSTVIPTGLNADGLPIGVQIVGPEYADLVTIGVAAALEREGFAFQPPPDYC